MNLALTAIHSPMGSAHFMLQNENDQLYCGPSISYLENIWSDELRKSSVMLLVRSFMASQVV